MPVAVNGEIAIPNNYFDNNSYIELEGEWDFYYQKFLLTDKLDFTKPDLKVNFPSVWTKYKIKDKYLPSYGYATYKLKILTNKEYNNLSLEIPDFYTSYKLWVDGKLISKNGEIGKNEIESKPFWLPYTKKISNIKNNSEIVIEVSNFIHSKAGAGRTITLGVDTYLAQKRETEIGQTFILTGILLMGGLFFLGLYLFGRKEKFILYFSLFYLNYSYRVFGTGLYLISPLFGQEYILFSLRIEYITLFLSVMFFALSTKQLYPDQTPDYFINLHKITALLLCALVLFTETIIYTQIIELYFVFLLISIIYIFYAFIKATFEGEKGAFISMISAFSFLGVVFINILNYFMVVPNYHTLSFLGYLLFFLLQSLVLSYKFAYSFKIDQEKANAGLKIKTDFIATMSHEIRTPMNGVIGMTDLLLTTKLSNEQRDYIETIKISGNNLLQIINEILDFSKIESGKMQIENIETDLLKSIEEVLALFNYNALQKNIDINYYIEPDVPRVIYTDYLKLKQVINNLLSNSIKFTEKGDVTINVRVLNIKNNLYNLEFSIADTGIGIPEDKKDMIFKPFTQIDSSMSRKYVGTGLGLVICKNIVEMLGGNIHSENNTPQGTKFIFNIKAEVKEFIPIYNKFQHNKKIYNSIKNEVSRKIINKKLLNLGFEVVDDINKADICINCFSNYKDTSEIKIPTLIIHDEISSYGLNENNLVKHIIKPVYIHKLEHAINELLSENIVETLNKTPHESQTQLKNIKILVAEDNKVNQKVIQKILNKLGIESEIVENGFEVIERVKTNNYDLIFMDMQMPEMNGIQATEKLRNELNFNNIIIAITANAMNEDKELCLRAGMNDYTTKPLKIDDIKHIIEKYF